MPCTWHGAKTCDITEMSLRVNVIFIKSHKVKSRTVSLVLFIDRLISGLNFLSSPILLVFSVEFAKIVISINLY